MNKDEFIAALRMFGFVEYKLDRPANSLSSIVKTRRFRYTPKHIYIELDHEHIRITNYAMDLDMYTGTDLDIELSLIVILKLLE